MHRQKLQLQLFAVQPPVADLGHMLSPFLFRSPGEGKILLWLINALKPVLYITDCCANKARHPVSLRRPVCCSSPLVYCIMQPAVLICHQHVAFDLCLGLFLQTPLTYSSSQLKSCQMLVSNQGPPFPLKQLHVLSMCAVSATVYALEQQASIISPEGFERAAFA